MNIVSSAPGNYLRWIGLLMLTWLVRGAPERTQVVVFGCNDIVCEYSRLTRADKMSIVDKMNEFRNRVAGATFAKFPYCVGNMKQIVWDEKIAQIAQLKVNTCPFVKAFVNPKHLNATQPKSELIPAHTIDYYQEKRQVAEVNDECDQITISEFAPMNWTEPEVSFVKAKNDIFEYISRGQMNDFWRIPQKGKNWKLIFRRADANKVGCGFMLRVERKNKLLQLKSYLTCIYCNYNMTLPYISKPPCLGCFANDSTDYAETLSKRQTSTNNDTVDTWFDQADKYKNLCSGESNYLGYDDIPEDDGNVRYSCVGVPNSNVAQKSAARNYHSNRANSIHSKEGKLLHSAAPNFKFPLHNAAVDLYPAVMATTAKISNRRTASIAPILPPDMNAASSWTQESVGNSVTDAVNDLSTPTATTNAISYSTVTAINSANPRTCPTYTACPTIICQSTARTCPTFTPCPTITCVTTPRTCPTYTPCPTITCATTTTTCPPPPVCPTVTCATTAATTKRTCPTFTPCPTVTCSTTTTTCPPPPICPTITCATTATTCPTRPSCPTVTCAPTMTTCPTQPSCPTMTCPPAQNQATNAATANVGSTNQVSTFVTTNIGSTNFATNSGTNYATNSGTNYATNIATNYATNIATNYATNTAMQAASNNANCETTICFEVTGVPQSATDGKRRAENVTTARPVRLLRDDDRDDLKLSDATGSKKNSLQRDRKSVRKIYAVPLMRYHGNDAGDEDIIQFEPIRGNLTTPLLSNVIRLDQFKHSPPAVHRNSTHSTFFVPNGTELNYIANPLFKIIINRY